jgi:hypothetical protein
VTARKLWLTASRANEHMPVVFGDAADCSRLLYWAVLVNVQFRSGGTRFVVDRLRKLGRRHAPQELKLRRAGRKIARGFIRPYAICFTPSFVISKRGQRRRARNGN